MVATYKLEKSSDQMFLLFPLLTGAIVTVAGVFVITTYPDWGGFPTCIPLCLMLGFLVLLMVRQSFRGMLVVSIVNTDMNTALVYKY